MRLDWANDWRLWFTRVSHPFDKCEQQLVVRLTLNAQFECLSPRREDPFDTLTAAQEWCEANDPAKQPKAVDPVASPVEADPLLIEAGKLLAMIRNWSPISIYDSVEAFAKSVVARFEGGTMPKESASPAVQPQFVKGQTVVCVDDRKAGDWLLNNQRYVIDGVFGNVVYFDKTPWHARRFRALTAEEQEADYKVTSQLYSVGDPCPTCGKPMQETVGGNITCAGKCFNLFGKNPEKIDVAICPGCDCPLGQCDCEGCSDATKPKFVVGQKVRVNHGMGCGKMLVSESEHMCSAVHDGRIEIDGINTQWDDSCFDVVEEAVIVPWESLAEVPLEAWFAQENCIWQRISGIDPSGPGYVDTGIGNCSMKDLFDWWIYTLDPRQDPPVIHRCGKAQRKAE